MRKVGKWLYGDKSYAVAHWVFGITCAALACAIIVIAEIVPLSQILNLVNSDVLSFSATMAGFELAAVTLLMSISGNQKIEDIKKIGSEKTLYKLFFNSIVLFSISSILMILNLYLFNTIALEYEMLKQIIGYISVATLWEGIVFFLSSIRMLFMIFR